MLDLKKLAGARYRVTLDESAAMPGQSREERLWLYRIEGKYGHVCVWGANLLSAYCRSNRRRPRFDALHFCEPCQVGDREFSVTFPPEQLDAIAPILKLRKRRVLSPEQRERATERLLALRARTLPEPLKNAPGGARIDA